MDISTEEWREIPGFFGIYSVSSLGRFRNNETGQMKSTPISRQTGYRLIKLSRLRTQKTYRAHSLVLTAFVGDRPQGYVTRHLNGVRHDNRLENLRWGTIEENRADAVLHNTSYSHYKGKFYDEHPNGKLSAKDVADIIEQLGERKQKDIAEDYGVDPSTISKALKTERERAASKAADASARAEMKLSR